MIRTLDSSQYRTEIVINGVGSNASDRIYLEEILNLADKHPRRIKITQTGFLDEESFLEYFQTVHLVFIPRGQTNGEVSGNMAYALGAGVPLILPQIDAFCEFQHNNYPLFYRVNDLHSIRTQINYVQRNYDAIATLSLNERTYWLDKFAPTKVAAEYLKHYDKLLNTALTK
ncbi:MAG: hypothetical protein R3A44_05855 [Caldilineaceae bacterium]